MRAAVVEFLVLATGESDECGQSYSPRRAKKSTVGTAYDLTARCLLDCGDWDRDGVGEVLVLVDVDRGESSEDDASFELAVYSYKRDKVVVKLSGFVAAEHFLSACAGPDLDEDGLAEIILGDPEREIDGNEGAGSVWIAWSESREVRCLISGTAEHEYLGYSVGLGGDRNEDGIRDLVVGCPGARCSTCNTKEPKRSCGTVRVVSPVSGEVLDSIEAPVEFCGGPREQEHWMAHIGDGGFGASLSCGSDLDGDGIRDTLIGFPMAFINGGDKGAVVAYSGKDSARLFDLSWPEDDFPCPFGFGAAIANIGDVDDDGVCDWVIAAPGSISGLLGVSGRTQSVLYSLVEGY